MGSIVAVSICAFGSQITDVPCGVSIGLCSDYISNFIILVNEGFVKRFVVLADKLTKGIVNVGVVEARVCAINLTCASLKVVVAARKN